MSNHVLKLNGRYAPTADTTRDDLLEDAYMLSKMVSDGLAALAYNMDTNREPGADITAHAGASQILYALGYLSDMAAKCAVSEPVREVKS